MRKKKIFPQNTNKSLSRATQTLYIIGMILLAVPLFYTVMQLSAHSTLRVPELKHYANILEHIVAGLTLLTGGCYLVERVSRNKKSP